MKYSALGLGMVVVLATLGCSKPTEVESTATGRGKERLRVVASFLPIYAHTARVAGDRAEVTMLLKADSGPHDYQLTPEDVKRIADADLFMINGSGIEEWLGDLVDAAGSARLKVIDTGAGVESSVSPAAIEIAGIPQAKSHDHGHDEKGHHHHHDEDGANPHYWLDPVTAMEQTRAIARALVAADPSNASAYEANATAYLAELEKLHLEFQAAMDALPGKNLITFHDAFPYLARRYGLNYVGYIEAFPEKDPTPGQLKSLVGAIGKHQVKVLFAETGYSPAILRSLAEQTGARVAELDTLEVGEADANAYLLRMRNNLKALQKAWE
jgi:zinc transport system substrate-binding protein